MQFMKKYNLPIYLIAGFNIFTLLAYVASPFVHEHEHGFAVFVSYFYILLNIFFLIFGYRFGVAFGNRRFMAAPLVGKDAVFFKYLSFFYAATFLIKYSYLLKLPLFDVQGMLNLLMVGLTDPALGYKLSVDELRVPQISWTLFFITSIFNGLYFIIGFISWKELSLPLRVVFLVFLFVEAFYWAGRGTNFGIISLGVIFVFVNLLNKNRGQMKNNVIYTLAIFLFSLIYFSSTMNARGGRDVIDLQTLSPPLTHVDESGLFIALIPDDFEVTALTIFSYLTQGYFNMAVAFDLDFLPSWFGGWNSSISDFYSLVGFDVSGRTYVNRLDAYGIDPRINWHSAYTWFANDFSFAGVPLVFCFLGFCVGLSWVRSINQNDLISKIIFVLLSAASVFSFANNNFIGYHFYSFALIFPYWFGKVMKNSR